VPVSLAAIYFAEMEHPALCEKHENVYKKVVDKGVVIELIYISRSATAQTQKTA